MVNREAAPSFIELFLNFVTNERLNLRYHGVPECPN